MNYWFIVLKTSVPLIAATFGWLIDKYIVGDNLSFVKWLFLSIIIIGVWEISAMLWKINFVLNKYIEALPV